MDQGLHPTYARRGAPITPLCTCVLQNPDAKADEVFVRCKPGLAVDSSHSTVTLADNRSVKVPTADIFAANPDGLVTPDNTMLIHLSEPTNLDRLDPASDEPLRKAPHLH